MKSLLLLWKKMASECAIRCCTSATIDQAKVEGRFKHEGLSFLTITLPNFGKDFERSLDLGRVDPSLFSGFRRRGGLPLFLGGFLDLVFDRSSGVLRDEPSIDAIRSIRQLTLMFGKIDLPCSDARVFNALQQFISCEQEVRESDAQLSSSDFEDFYRVSDLLFRELFTEVDWKVFDRTLLPKHGPGATADKLRGNSKYRQHTWTVRLEEYFPFVDYVLPNSSFSDVVDDVRFLEPGSEIPIKVITVPKTLKTPRIIGIEPTAMQYAQQAVLSGIREELDKSSLLTNFIGLDDQTPNQRLAKSGSLRGHLATLDLSEASDRVSNQLVRTMLRDHPHLHGAVDACRSRRAVVNFPNRQETVRLAKFAPMGSALCFPMEAMVFLTLIFLGIEQALSTQLDVETIEKFQHKVRVFGDDLIVPKEYVPSVVAKLEHFGARVNANKSFWTGKFRESCGKEYYNGADVSIVRVREVFPSRRTDATGVNSLVSLRNQLYADYYWDTTDWLDELIRKLIIHYPVVEPTSPVLGRHDYFGYKPSSYDRKLHRPMVKGYVVSAPLPIDRLDGYAALTKTLLMLERDSRGLDAQKHHTTKEPRQNEDHLERSGRPRVVNIKLVNATPY